MNPETPFETFLNQHDEEAWSATLVALLRFIHEVDRNATQIWFGFYPLPLQRALEQSDDREKLVQQLLLQGDYEVKHQVDTSHRFLYGHRSWPQVKQAVEQHAEAFNQTARATLADQILGVARALGRQKIARANPARARERRQPGLAWFSPHGKQAVDGDV